MRMRRSLLLIFMMAVVCSSFGQDKEKSIYGQLVDNVTRKELNNAKVTLMTMDSVVVDTARTWYEFTPKYKMNVRKLPINRFYV